MAPARIVANCPAPCGVRLEGEVDPVSREFVYRFLFPEGSGSAAAVPRTEVAGTHLATFAPDSKDWFVPCPACGRRIPFGAPAGGRTRT